MKGITCPVLLCVGEADTTAIPDDTRTFASGLVRSEVVVLPGMRHPFEELDLDAFVPVLNAFWDRAR